MRVPKTPAQLAAACRAAKNRIFFGPAQDLARREGFHPGLGKDASTRSILNHPKTKHEAEALLVAYKVEEDLLNLLYGDFQSVEYLIANAHKNYLRVIHNAQATVDRLRFIHDDKHSQIERIRAGEFPDWLTEPTAKMLAAREEAGKQLSGAEGELERVKHDALKVREERIAYLDQLRAGEYERPEQDAVPESHVPEPPPPPVKPKAVPEPRTAFSSVRMGRRGRVWKQSVVDTFLPALVQLVRLAPARRDGSGRIQFSPEGRDISSVPVNGVRVSDLAKRRGGWFQGQVTADERRQILG